MNVLFVCIGNAGRSQMAQSFLESFAGGRHVARSAGTRPEPHVHPEVVEAMGELGFDLTQRVPRRLDPQADAEWADVVVTMGCGDACPVLPGTRYVDWQLDDPKGKHLHAVRDIRDRVGKLVRELVEELG